MRKKFRTRALSVLLSATMVFSSMPMAYAAPLGEEADTVSEHEHSEECYSSELICGYDTETEEATDSNSVHVHTQKCYALECEGEDDSVIIEMDGVTISTDASYLMINDRFEVDGVEYKEIGPEKAQLWDASGVSGIVEVPEIVTNDVTGEIYEIVSISEDAFAGNKNLTGITIDEHFEGVTGNLFDGCSKLKDVTIGNISVIGDGWFKNSGVQNITFAECDSTISGENSSTACIEIGENAFEGCTKLKTFELPETIKSLGAYAFKNCTNLETVILNDEIEIIEEGTFYGCSKLEYVNNCYNVTRVEDQAFENCINFEASLSLWRVEYIGDAAFRNCSALDTVIENAKKIGAYAYADCVSLEYLHITDNVESIGDYAFMNT